ncbi:MAG: magnesium transporter [Puniceicoccales bacterium]|jgi:magnesium transporter|nr:magnesium transporter [Puniceicoccales bacterium]
MTDEEQKDLDENSCNGELRNGNTEDYEFEELMGLYEHDFEGLDRLKLSRTSPHALGQFLMRLEPADQTTFLRKLSDRTAGEILSEMDSEISAEVLVLLKDLRALRILEKLEPDDAAYIVRQLELNDRDRLLGKLPIETAKIIYELLNYDADTAGGVMTPHVNKIHADWTVDESIQKLRADGAKNENLDIIYVVDGDGRLAGSVSLHQLILARGGQIIENIFDSNIQGACHANEPTQQVAQAMAEFDMKNVPVLDAFGRLIGIITHDDVIDILRDHATKDIQILHGAGADENIHDPIAYSVAKRNPWLLVNLITAALGAFVVSHFQPQIEQLTLLAVFMTMITSLGGNAGGQTLAISIRSLALGEWKSRDTLSICFREMAKGILNGIITGFVAAVVSSFLTRNPRVGIAIFLAMTLNMATCGLAGAMIPYLLHRLKFDPAQSAYIFLTMITDTMGMYIFLTLGCWFLL